MSIRWTQKPQVNIKLETGKYHKTHTREQSFITSCINELKEKGNTWCFEKWQIEEIRKKVDIDIKETKDGYFLTRKLERKNK